MASWSPVTVSDTAFSKLLRRNTGAGATIGNTGYYVGGKANSDTDPSITQGGDFLQTGVVVFNASSEIWDDASSGGLNTQGTMLTSKTVTIPAFGLDGRGLLVVLGGQDPGLGGSATLLSLNNITIYIPI